MIFDTHCHLNSEQLYPKIDEVIKTAKEAGVNRFLVVGYDKKTSELAVKIAKEYDECYAAIGFHPTEIMGVSEEEYNQTMSLVDEPKVVAIGEIGLDYHWVKDPRDRLMQKEWFIKQIEFANKHNKPIIIHNRDAFSDCLEIVKEHTAKCSGVMHCYSGSVEYLKDVLDAGLLIGLDGPLTFTNAKTPKEVCAAVPMDKLLIETDCPYLTPHPFRGQENQPKYLSLVLEEVSRIKGISKEEVESILYENSNKLFGIK